VGEAESPSVISVARISVTPVKSLGLLHPEEVELTCGGVPEDRRFYLVDDEGRLFNGVRHGPLVSVRPRYVAAASVLELEFPDGRVVRGEVADGEPLTTDFWGRPVAGHVVEGPWADALSRYAGAGVRLVRSDRAGDASDVHVVTLVSEESCAALGAHVGGLVDARRFRMLFTVTGCAPHGEDSWIGRTVGVGGALIRIVGPVPRCAVTTQNPATGVPDLDTLRGISAYRGLRDARYADFGVYADVERPGRVRVGDAVHVPRLARVARA
jgi:uncharacterized protein